MTHVPPADFQLAALYHALDERRVAEGLGWEALTRAINDRAVAGGAARPHAIAASTVKGLRDKPVAEGDGVLQMLRWLGRTPESFVPGHPLADAPEAALPDLGPDRVLRWDVRALHRAVEERRAERRLTWPQAAREVGCSPASLAGLATAQRVGFPGVMRILRWLGRPAAQFTRASEW